MTQHGDTSEGYFVPMVRGIAADEIGVASNPQRGDNGSYTLEQGFTIQWNHHDFTLTTVMSHTITVTNGVVTAATARIIQP